MIQMCFFIIDHLLLIKPVKVLEGENIHNVNSKTKTFLLFYFLVIEYFSFESFTRLFGIL